VTIKAYAKHKKKSIAQLAREWDMPYSTLYAVANDKKPSVNELIRIHRGSSGEVSFLDLCWNELSAETFAHPYKRVRAGKTYLV